MSNNPSTLSEVLRKNSLVTTTMTVLWRDEAEKQAGTVVDIWQGQMIASREYDQSGGILTDTTYWPQQQHDEDQEPRIRTYTAYEGGMVYQQYALDQNGQPANTLSYGCCAIQRSKTTHKLESIKIALGENGTDVVEMIGKVSEADILTNSDLWQNARKNALANNEEISKPVKGPFPNFIINY